MRLGRRNRRKAKFSRRIFSRCGHGFP
jgi:hypothetical protein